jgi:DNA mismatch repair protein MSH2
MIRNKKEYMEIATQKSGVLFTTAELRQLSQSFDDLSRQYDIQQQTVVKEILQITSTYCPVLETLNQVIAHLDVMTS